MYVSDFDYYLPDELIAQKPLVKRDESRMLVLDKNTGDIEHKHFYDCIDYLSPQDILVVNDTRVIPARLFGFKTDNSRVIEVFLLKRIDYHKWNVLLKPGKKVHIGDTIEFSDKLCAELLSKESDGVSTVKFSFDGIFEELLDSLGNIPLPPYIKEKLENPDRYQTVYAKHDGSSAAPTAGLHFTEGLIDRIKEKGVKIVPVLLHVGLGTFRPVKVDRVEDHIMHSEFITVEDSSAKIINETKKRNGKVVAVGTTSVRVLESVSDENGVVHPYTGETGIYIYPGYKFKVVDAMITNFHLPKSTLLMLVSAFAGKDNIMNAYKTAVSEKYRFFSFGDSMFIK